MKLRVKFSKNGPIKYIGHLDTMRYFQKAVRRAGIKVTYSGGFSPHQIMSFAYPLGVGMTTDGDYFDMEVDEAESAKDILNRLEGTMADGVHILQVVQLPEKAQGAMAVVAASAYAISIDDSCKPSFSLIDGISWFGTEKSVPYIKKTAKSEIEMDLKERVFALSLMEDGRIYIQTDSSSAGNIKPTMVLESIYSHFGEAMPEFAVSVHRLETYMRQDGMLVPLSMAGSDF